MKTNNRPNRERKLYELRCTKHDDETHVIYSNWDFLKEDTNSRVCDGIYRATGIVKIELTPYDDAEYIEYLESRTKLLISLDEPKNDKDRADYYSHRASYYNELWHNEHEKVKELEQELQQNCEKSAKDLAYTEEACEEWILKVVESVFAKQEKGEISWELCSTEEFMHLLKRAIEKEKIKW